MKPTLQLTGIGLRAPHYEAFLAQKPPVAWVEVHSENYFGDGGKDIQTLEEVRAHYPVSLHGVSLSIGSTDELNWHHLKKLRDLIWRVEPCLVSDHLCWSSVHGQYLHDLLPLPFTHEAVQQAVSRIQQIQEFLRRQILIENISRYIQFRTADMSEQDFLIDVATQAGCGILLDINNAHVNAQNLGLDANAFLGAIPAHLIQEIHLAGGTTITMGSENILIDSHNQPVPEVVWDLYRNTIERIGIKPTIVEWDSDLPSLDTLYNEASQAETILRAAYVPAKHSV